MSIIIVFLFLCLPALGAYLLAVSFPKGWETPLLIVMCLIVTALFVVLNQRESGPFAGLDTIVFGTMAVGAAAGFFVGIFQRSAGKFTDRADGVMGRERNATAQLVSYAMIAAVEPIVLCHLLGIFWGVTYSRLVFMFTVAMAVVGAITGVVIMAIAVFHRSYRSFQIAASVFMFGLSFGYLAMDADRAMHLVIERAYSISNGKSFCVQVGMSDGYRPARTQYDLSPLVMRTKGFLDEHISVFHALMFVTDGNDTLRYNWSYRLGTFVELPKVWSGLSVNLDQVCQPTVGGGFMEAPAKSTPGTP